MPSKKITKALIEMRQQEKSQAEVNDFILKYIRKFKIQGVNTSDPAFVEKVETLRNKMLETKPQKQTGGGGLRGMLEDLDNLENLKETIATGLQDLETLKSTLENELRGVKIKINEIQNKQIDWEEIQNRPDNIGQDEFQQEKLRIDESQKRNFNLLQLLKDEIENVKSYFEQIVKGISSEIAQLRNKKINHSELLGITKDQHHPEKHTLESHITSKLMEELKRLVGGGYVDDLHQHRMVMQEQSKTFGEPWGITRNDLAYYFINNETPTGDINGVNTDFVLANEVESGSERIFVNGMRMQLTGDYTISSQTITFLTAPPTGSVILVDYVKK